MSNIDNDILLAKQTIEQPKEERFERIYPFSNENIFKCFSRFELKDKNVLSVLASSDQIFDMYLKGAKQIDTFDLNLLTKYYFYLKKAAIASGLTLEEYLNFFSLYNRDSDGLNDNILYLLDNDEFNSNVFDKNIFNKISNNLDETSYIFWNELFKTYDRLYIKKRLFIPESENKSSLLKQIKYLNNNSYKKLQNNIDSINITFINSDIRDLPYKLNKNYDFMYFSNIVEYVDNMYDDRSLDTNRNQKYKLTEFKKLIKEFKPFLNNEGKILLGYLFNIDVNLITNPIYNKEARDAVFNKNEFDYYNFSVVNGKKLNTDSCIVYTKK